uniref:Uncharacterized protein n=1 Tax=Oryza sativa subsp. japonica TaxID=39947 RepID=Q6EPU5_ORYSJ|nr:hypothetical protein [Oryza sativa Japonica Group]
MATNPAVLAAAAVVGSTSTTDRLTCRNRSRSSIIDSWQSRGCRLGYAWERRARVPALRLGTACERHALPPALAAAAAAASRTPSPPLPPRARPRGGRRRCATHTHSPLGTDARDGGGGGGGGHDCHGRGCCHYPAGKCMRYCRGHHQIKGSCCHWHGKCHRCCI